MDNIINQVTQRFSGPQLAGIAAGLIVVVILFANVMSGGSALEEYAVGTWTCVVMESGEPSSVNEGRLDALPEPFDKLDGAVDLVTTFPYAEPEDQMLYAPGSSYIIGRGWVTILEDGSFSTSGLASSEVEFGTWTIQDGVPVVRFDNPDAGLDNYAAAAKPGQTDASLVSWENASARIFDARVDWSDLSVSITLNSQNAIYQADCVKADNDGTPLDY